MTKNFFKDKTLLITGGTGSLGKSLLNFFIDKKIALKKIIIFSRDEFKQYEMARDISKNNIKNIRFFLGDIRDKDRLRLAFKGVDIIIHAAALKQVTTAEYNPFEFIKTNILGAQNIIEVSLENNISNVLALSTDKASSPINLYGATKLCSDKLFISANNIKGNNKIKFSVVRYGNVFGSRGSVLHNFLQQKKNKSLLITDKRMTRFSITLDQAINFIILSLKASKGGEIFIPKIPSFNITDLAKAVCEKCTTTFDGIKAGEKLHEEMISIYDSVNTIEYDNYYIILQNIKDSRNYKNSKLVVENFSYSSNNNKQFLSINNLKKLISSFNY
jgi:UDP-N-acetylglucosamine 4,6-dehydratase (inverting)